MEHEMIALAPMKIVGLELRTTNQDGQSAKDIPEHWGRFTQEGIKDKITNKVSDTVYGIYTNYEEDHTKPYSLVIGYEVASVPEKLPEGCVLVETADSSYACPQLSGDFPGSVYQTWQKVWNSDLKRTFTTDFEVYDETFDPTEEGSSGISIYVAVE